MFEWHGQLGCSAVGEALVKHCPKLRVYNDYCKSRSYDRHYYDFLGHFEHLIQATLTTKSTGAHDLKSILQILAQKNQLRELTVYQSDAKMNEPTIGEDESFFVYFDGFSSLRTIVFHICYEMLNIDFGQHLFQNLLTSMQGLQKITLMSKRGSKVFNIPKILPFISQIQEISINEIGLNHMPAEVRRIQRFIQQTNDQRQNNSNIRIIMNAEQAREFFVYKNFEKIATIVVKSGFTEDDRFGFIHLTGCRR